ncbi:MAG: hypothetical protein SGARI_004346, partial [Bacillariaceae sp.]
MIELEQKFYQPSSYLFPKDCEEQEVTGRNGGVFVDRASDNGVVSEETRRSSLSMIQEMASLVTDLEIVAAESSTDIIPEDGPQQPSPKTPPALATKARKSSSQKAYSPTSSTIDLYEEQEQSQPNSSDTTDDSEASKTKRRSPSALEISCLSGWRHQMFDWTCSVCQGVVGEEHSRTVVATTFSILDRYLAVVLSKETDELLSVSREEFQLFCMVSLYIAAKTLISAAHNKLTIATMVCISRQVYSAQDITATERDILLALDWHVNPPTVSCFCRLFLELFPLEVQDWDVRMENDAPPMRSMARHQCEYLAELALDDVFFLDKAATTVGLAIVVLVTDSLRNKQTSRV